MKMIMLRKLRMSGKRKLFLIPYLFTFANALCGFLSIMMVLEGNFIASALFIIAAGITDMLDGRLARAFGCTSMLGMELDSLCDAVSFCLAPTVLLYSWRLHDIGFVAIAAAMLFLCAGLFRLAKFNTIPNTHSAFTGLPTTITALLLASLVANAPVLAQGPLYWLFTDYALVGLVTALALLMISPIRFPSFKKTSMRRSTICIIATTLAVAWIVGSVKGYPILFTVLSAYIVCSIAVHGWMIVRRYSNL
ncbi:MAG TPA: CDP-diacylglycerol--serine O-phosphatidyltransferase [Candidatus Babeliales bacterium]|nr:CDP-diacylglycerol--serine O-phosphatidyltransferase [Candidatus Babeliales bacterium]